MTLRQVVAVVGARWRSAFTAWLLIVGVVVAVSLLRTPLYTATASVVLDVKSPDPIAGMVLPGMTAVSYMGTQLNVVQSERVALRAVQALKLDEDLNLKAEWQAATDGRGDFKSWISDLLLRKLDATPARDSNVIQVAYTASDPAFAAAVANAFVTGYIETTLDLRVEPARRHNAFFDDRSRHLREDLERAQQRLSAYQQQNGIVATDERLDVETMRLSELTTQLVALEGQANESSSRQRQLKSQSGHMQEVLASPLVIGLTTELARQESRLNELTQRLGDRNPQVDELRASVVNLRTRIEAETARVAASVTVNDSVNRTRLAQLRADVDAQRSKLLLLKGQRDEAAVLQRDVENAKASYDSVMARAMQTSIESQATQTNVSVLKRATAPAFPSSPKLLLNLAVGVMVGVLVGISVALMRELNDARLRNDHDVTDALRQPVLGALPRRSRHASPGRLRLRLTSPLSAMTPARLR
ncbi:chain length determinant protein EpsF [Aquincola sp. J276]|uniref:chain length determinant protein EpsF n=1 Tax=Aquincola sp. J276 TaxID=2898432 RepID=UPI002150C06C|nr:chain length determinant protein EpsF [Aquincola sp. J276]MCR5868793.1 chain length determinant protein EpsF [Aquincola sp. J276]